MFFFTLVGVWIDNIALYWFFSRWDYSTRWFSWIKLSKELVVVIMKTDSSLIGLAKPHLSYFNMEYILSAEAVETSIFFDSVPNFTLYIFFLLPSPSPVAFTNIFSQSRHSLFIYTFPSRYYIPLSGNERFSAFPPDIAATKQTEIFINIGKNCVRFLSGSHLFSLAYTTTVYYTTLFPPWESVREGLIATITLNLDFFVPPTLLPD